MITAERALNRIKQADTGLYDAKTKIQRLRRLVVGDADAMEDGTAPANNLDQAYQVHRAHRSQWQEVLVQQIKEGRNNDLLKFLWVLASITAYQFPKVEIQGITSHEQIVNSQYLKGRMREHPFGCNAIHHARMALLDYLMGGLGFCYLTTARKGQPVVQWADTLDMKWDQTARLVCDVRWMSITVCKPIGEWIAMFGVAKFAKWLGDPAMEKERGGWDLPFELEFYYDVDQDRTPAGGIRKNGNGNYKVFIKIGDTEYDPDPILELENPNFFDLGDGENIPFLPFCSMFYSSLPGLRLPSGVAEKMLPAQIAVWRGMERLQNIIETGVSFWEVPEGLWADEEAKQAFLDGMDGGVVTISKDKFGQIKLHAPGEPPKGLIQYIMDEKRSIQGQAGVSPSSVGEATPGIKFAAEQYDIRANAALTTTSIGKDNADFWERLIRMFLAKGAAYDKAAFTCMIDGVQMKFGEGERFEHVAGFLRPDAEIFVSEDSMRFMPPGQKIAMAEAMLKWAMQLQQFFPGMLEPAVRSYLEASGVDNPEERLKPPQPAPAPPAGMPGPGMPGAAAPGGGLGAPALENQSV